MTITDPLDVQHQPYFAAMAQGQDFVLCDANLHGQSARLFYGPRRIIEVWREDKIEPAIEAIERHLAQGGYAAGYIAYEAAGLIDPRMSVIAQDQPAAPELCFGLFDHMAVLPGPVVDALLAGLAGPGDFELRTCGLSRTQTAYIDDIRRIKDYLSAGDSYQINYTLKLLAQMSGEPLALYQALRARQPVDYGAYVNLSGRRLLSRSPELFLRKSGSRLMSRPMKGTALRHSDPTIDRERQAGLVQDPKTRAENMMIVDLLRNDLGRVARDGTVEAYDLMRIETYRTVHQVTSAVACEVADDLGLLPILTALFPCGSITGAPKIRSMEIIAELEKVPRGVYTGAIGYVLPNKDMCFNVAIRTLDIAADGGAQMGIGSGIVYESKAAEEYQECLAKAMFLRQLELADA